MDRPEKRSLSANWNGCYDKDLAWHSWRRPYKVALEDDPTNFVLMQAMGPNVSGVIVSAVVAGILYTLRR